MDGYTDTRSDREKAIGYAFQSMPVDFMSPDGVKSVDVDALLLVAEKFLLFLEGAAD